MKMLIRLVLVAGLVWSILFGLAKVIRVSPDWPLWAVALCTASLVELLLGLYRYECAAVTSARARWMIGLRMAALSVLVWILVEPTWVRTVTSEQQREVVVLLDESASMHLTDDGESLSRLEKGEGALAEADLVTELSKKMRVRGIRVARSVIGEGETSAAGWDQATDLAAGLGTVLEQVPPDQLGGVILVSDGQHNRPARVEDVARRFGILDAPIGVLAVGSSAPPRDAAVVALRAPEAIHLGDRMRVAAEVKFDGYKGKKATLRLLRAGEVLEERQVSIPQDHHREEVRFAQVPEEGGVGDYRVELVALEGERFEDNNAWDFETSITDARTNVLLVDGHPRWEFRYLRNLFYGRDKSVHLQWLLLHPDRISGQAEGTIAASASRDFGDARADRLPQSEEEWRKFDVIILGDVARSEIDDGTWEIIERCVNERGALLVMISGPQFMPHAISSEVGQSLVPVEVEWGVRNYYSTSGKGFRVGVTAEGEGHPVVQQSGGGVTNEEVWEGFPVMRWRHPVKGLKEGSEVLLVAKDAGAVQSVGAGGLSSALEDLAKRREREADSALLVTRQAGKGKVALLLTDRTWRLREGAGDVYHHRFWGNLMRWGAGPVLRVGGQRFRLGTDQLTYTPDDRVQLVVRMRDTNLNPVSEDGLQIEVTKDGELVQSVSMIPVAESNGLHECQAGPFREAGRYEVSVVGGRSGELIAQDGLGSVSAGFRVVGSLGPVELADTTLNLPLLQTIADLSGGRVFDCDSVVQLGELFLGGKNEREEIRETSLWDHWGVICLLVLLLGSEWIIRRGGGLA